MLGYGNPARGDDGLGPALVERIGSLALEGVETRVDYQLCVEDAMDIGRFDQVIFVDASLDATPPYLHYRLAETLAPTTLDTHSVSPEALIHLARTLFGATSSASILAIRGYDFTTFSERLSPAARRNLNVALDYLIKGLGGDVDLEPESRSQMCNGK